ncbi:putative NADH-plastoquinone oxidoreductase [Capsicum annuum]|nr:putative NADH-plastoquinone oxidoreductase [Capsicum annuum]KAF3660105.1 putative NADH-plastoquinone oxidoreductase [Capsicum annuum]
MAEEPQFGGSDAVGGGAGNKRKYDDQTTPSPGTRRPTGFSAPISSLSPPDGSAATGGGGGAASYNSVPPPMDDFQLAKQKAQEIAARLLNSAEAKKPRVDNNGAGGGTGAGGGGFDSLYEQVLHQEMEKLSLIIQMYLCTKTSIDNNGARAGGFDSYELDNNCAGCRGAGGFDSYEHKPVVTPSVTSSYGYPGQSKKIEIPNGRVGVIIGKGGETIKYLQLQSGAKIQVTRDMDADPNSPNRAVELMGTSDQISKAEQLINEVLAEADAGGSGLVSRRLPGQLSGGEQFSMKVPNNKVGLVIGKGGETIKNMQARTGARIQVIPLHLPPGDTSQERTVQIDGSSDQIEAAKQLVYEVISEISFCQSSFWSTASVYGNCISFPMIPGQRRLALAVLHFGRKSSFSYSTCAF